MSMHRQIAARRHLCVSVCGMLLVNCLGCGQAGPQRTVPSFPPSAQNERDDIFILLAYAIALKDWQEQGPDKRGHNIAAVLVDPSGTNAVAWGRNCNTRLANGTQHAETRAIIDYLDESSRYNLAGYTLYSTLEPCPQCAGMLLMQSVQRTVFGQTDPEYGGALDRLNAYPRSVESVRAASGLALALDDAYRETGGHVVAFLRSDTARSIFEQARDALDGFKVTFPENRGGLASARRMLTTVPDHFVPIDPDI